MNTTEPRDLVGQTVRAIEALEKETSLTSFVRTCIISKTGMNFPKRLFGTGKITPNNN